METRIVKVPTGYQVQFNKHGTWAAFATFVSKSAAEIWTKSLK